MSGFENYPRETRQIELELARKGIALGIDWDDVAAVSALAREALDFKPDTHPAATGDTREMLRIQIFGLAQLMLKVMTESAKDQILSHGGEVWKTFGRALWREWQARQP
jgi:hypothetical protein